ncbi:Nicotinate-nucleotide pyrophosphorylase [carboxylating] [Smittium culicis]|uniref:Nicotinate-nucleotide pyrophosphorylase [carboxylating] n=2 Tax=Smittium culicis TaxID=133412 RepID=A0A1R1YKW3_9FUNG|nr:Nicotinate-nucleotide pyrophosphorylase [carboxylating] [Smittium culicis]
MENLLCSSISSTISAWLAEDIPSFDYGGYVVGSVEKTGHIYGKARGILAGVPFANEVFKQLGCKIEWFMEEGNEVDYNGTRIVVAKVTGPSNKILQGERLALNILARCSGIATRARKLKNLAEENNYNGYIAGTRKTTPGFRLIEKYGMLVGGIDGHRMDLSSMIMLKDNHVWSTGSITNAVKSARKVGGFSVKIEVECQSVEEAHEAITAGADIVMLDNFRPSALKEGACTIKQEWSQKGRQILVEASGGITEDTIQDFFSPGKYFYYTNIKI